MWQYRIQELINYAKKISKNGGGLLIGADNTISPGNVMEVSDFTLIHANGVKDP